MLTVGRTREPIADTTAAPNNRAIVYRGKPQRERSMPWPGTTFKKHNHSLTDSEARSAGRQATAMLDAGTPEGVAIATANKRINKLRKRGAISEKQHGKLSAKYGGKDQQPIDAASR